MKVLVNSKNLQAELGAAISASDKKKIIPVLSQVRLSARPGEVEIACTNMEFSVRTTVSADVREPGQVCLPAQKLFEITRLLSGDVSVEAGIDRAIIKCGASRFKIAGMPAADFPEIPGFPEGARRTPAAWWEHGLRHVLFAVGDEKIQNAYSGVRLEWHGDWQRLVATDGHRLSLWETGQPTAEKHAVLVPQKPLKLLKRFVSELDEKDDVHVATDQNHIFLGVGQREIISRLMVGSFPGYESLLDLKPKARAAVSAEALGDACRRVAVFADQLGRGVRLEFSQGKIVLSVRPPSSDEEGVDEVDCAYEGEPMHVILRDEYLLEFLSLVEGDVEIGLLSGHDPVRLRPVESPWPCVYLVMPMRG